MLNRWRKIVKIWLKYNRKRWGNWQHGKGIQNIQKDTTPMNFGRHDWNMHCKSATSIRTTNDNMPERNCRRLKTKIVNCHTSPKGLRPTTPKHECQILHPKTTPNNQTWQPNATIQFTKPNKQIYQIHEIPQPKTRTNWYNNVIPEPNPTRFCLLTSCKTNTVRFLTDCFDCQDHISKSTTKNDNQN